MNKPLEKSHILVVESEVTPLKMHLKQAGYQVETCTDVKVICQSMLEQGLDLLIVDLSLLKREEPSICKAIRDQYRGPVLILTDRAEDIDQVAGLEIGADDYVCKPVDPRLLTNRVKALICRHNTPRVGNAPPPSRLVFDHLSIDNRLRSVYLSGEPIPLSTPEYDLLWLLASHAGETLSRANIFNQLRGFEYDGMSRFVDITISQLRQKLGDNHSAPPRIKTIRGKGYLFVDSTKTE